jgi:hypothetical protein
MQYRYLYLSLAHHKGRLSCIISKQLIFSLFILFVGHSCPTEPGPIIPMRIRILPTKINAEPNPQYLRICDILVRIPIPGSVPLTNGSGWLKNTGRKCKENRAFKNLDCQVCRIQIQQKAQVRIRRTHGSRYKKLKKDLVYVPLELVEPLLNGCEVRRRYQGLHILSDLRMNLQRRKHKIESLWVSPI